MQENTFRRRDWQIGDRVYLICATWVLGNVYIYQVEEGYVESVVKEFGYPDPEHPIYTHSINVRHGNRDLSHLSYDRDTHDVYLDKKAAMAAARRRSMEQEHEIQRIIDTMAFTLDSLERIKFIKYKRKGK